LNSISRKTAWLIGAVVAALLAVPGIAAAADYGPDFDEQPIVSGLTLPTTAAWSSDGRMFVAEKSGIVKVLVPGASIATPILDLRTEVYDRDDRGLLGLALDTDFEHNGYMYLLYAHDLDPLFPDQQGAAVARLARVHVDNANVVSDSTLLLGSEDGCVSETFPGVEYEAANDLDCLPAENPSHSIGTVLSAPDGTLYVGNGDASSFAEYDPLSFRVYREDSFAGKILHVDRDGHGLPGHAFCPSDIDLTHVCTKLHAKAFRNPFRFKLRADGSLAVGDVGWSSREEIDIIRSAGKNYGWPCYEGITQTAIYKDATAPGDPDGPKLCDPEYSKEGTPDADVPPNHDYGHTLTNAIVAGPTYPGGPYPDAFDGSTFFGDYAAGFLKRVAFDGADQNPVVEDVASNWIGVDLMLTPDNEIAYVDVGDFGPGTGSIKRIVYAPSAGAPKARAEVEPTTAAKDAPLQFTGSGSTDPDGDTLAYHWDLGDGSESTEPDPTHAYAIKDTYTATLTVDDGHGHSDSDSVEVAVFDSPPTPTILSPTAGSTYRDGNTVQLEGSATDGQPGPISLSWNVLLHHNGHIHQIGTFDGPTAQFDAPTDHDADCHFEIRLRATDVDGEWSERTVVLDPETVPFSLTSTPTGAPVSYGGVTHAAPFATQSAIGLKTSISAGSRFTAGSDNYHFEAWSDGGARAHQVTIPANALGLGATYLEDKANGRTATASSVQDGGIPTGPNDPELAAGKAVDDDPSSRWSSDKTDTEWWQVDLGSARQVKRVDLDWEHAYASRYRILTSLDGIHFSLAAERDLDGALTQVTRFSSRLARYVRVQGVARGTQFGISFWEARVLGPPDDAPLPEDKAAGRLATASTVQGDDPARAASNAVDEDSATRWGSQSLDGQWLQVDLGDARLVDAVELNWEAAYASQYEIQTSLDGVSWTTAASVSIAAPGLQRTAFSVRWARHVRIQAIVRATSFGVSLWDARVYGPVEPPPDTTPPPDDGPGPDTTPPEKPPITTPTPSYGELILDTRGLLGYWPLGDDGRKVAKALIRISPDGSRRFDGRDSVPLPKAKVGKPGKVSVELWVSPDPAKPPRVRVLATDARSALADGFTLALDAKRRPIFSVGRSARRRGTAVGRALATRSVHHVVGTYDGKRVRLYVDGSLRSTRRYSGGIAYLRSRKALLGRPALAVRGGPAAFKGRLDEVAIYGSALSAATVARHFRRGD
jgi:glucose/arabinose dehydrogenase/PKD repeat protein